MDQHDVAKLLAKVVRRQMQRINRRLRSPRAARRSRRLWQEILTLVYDDWYLLGDDKKEAAVVNLMGLMLDLHRIERDMAEDEQP